jgi:uncharacterized spore protein YtfJ
MTHDFQRLVDDRLSTRVDSLLTGLAERLGASAKVETVFGPPVERDGVTVIPVAKARWGFGGGSGSGSGEGSGDSGEGGGGGGGIAVSPAGFIELRGGEARYRPIYDPLQLTLLAAGLALAALLALKWKRR